MNSTATGLAHLARLLEAKPPVETQGLQCPAPRHTVLWIWSSSSTLLSSLVAVVSLISNIGSITTLQGNIFIKKIGSCCSMLEWPKLGFYPKLWVDLMDLSSRDQKRQKAKPDIFTETHFNDWIQTLDRVYWQHGHAHLLPLLPLMVFLLMMISLQDSQPTGSGNWTTCRNILINIYILAKFYKYNFS